MLKKIVLVFAAVALAKAQIPSLGWCPEYVPMANFDLNRFMGVWYEAERYFQLSEVVSRCVAANYTRGHDGKVRVSNEVTNRFTGVKRVLEGEIKAAASKSEEGKLLVKYTTVPLTPETQYSVLETDYKNYAVLWSCSSFGPIHAQNAWLMTRKRVPSGDILQKAYGVLDKYKISKTFFVKTDQAECAYEVPEPAPAPEVEAAPAPAPAPAAPAKEPVETESAGERKASEGIHLRSAAVLPPVEAVEETRKEEPAVLADAPAEAAIPISPAEENRFANPEPVAAAAADDKPAAAEAKPQEVEFKPIAPESIPEVILKVAESAKESPAAPIPEDMLPSASPVAEESKTVEVVVPAESKPEIVEAPLAAEPAKELPKIAEESKPETAPIEEPKPAEAEIKLAEEPKPVETPESKPLEPLPAVRASEVPEIEEPLKEAEKIVSPESAVLPEAVAPKSAEGIVPVEAEKEVEVPASPAAEEILEGNAMVKTLVVPEIEKSAEPAKIPEGEAILKSEVPAAALPETILDPVVPEAPMAAAQPLKTLEAAEESKAEVIAEAPKTLEAKP